jgi:hypothetical protein
MPTNANTFNSRVTSEALEAKFRQVFPAQGGAELVQDLFASGVIQPVIDFSNVAEGSVLAENLQTAWDFSTGSGNTSGSTDTWINNTGFWRIQGFAYINDGGSGSQYVELDLYDGSSAKSLFYFEDDNSGEKYWQIFNAVVFLRSGDSFRATANTTNTRVTGSWRQIADVNGNLVNPLGFVFS